MKKFPLITMFLLLVSLTFAQEATTPKKMPTRFQSVPMAEVEILQEGEGKHYCPRCGMTLPMFYKTNHAGEVNGTTEQYCSIHCLAETMTDRNVSNLKVVDNTTLKFIDATKAWYVMGSSKAGTMSKVSKYAFRKQEDAETFSKSFGGDVADFNQTLTAVKANLSKESKMIAKKQAMMAEKGKKMFSKMCQPIDTKFTSVAEAKAYLKSEEVCGKIKDKQLQAIALYLKSLNQ